MFNTASLQGVKHHSLDVSEVTTADLDGDPESGPHFQVGQYPDHPLLCSNESPDLIGLKLTDDEAFQHPIAEPGSACSRRFEPAGDGAPGHALDSSHSRYRKPVDTHVDDFIEQRPGFVQPIIGCSVGWKRRFCRTDCNGSAAVYPVW